MSDQKFSDQVLSEALRIKLTQRGVFTNKFEFEEKESYFREIPEWEKNYLRLRYSNVKFHEKFQCSEEYSDGFSLEEDIIQFPEEKIEFTDGFSLEEDTIQFPEEKIEFSDDFSLEEDIIQFPEEKIEFSDGFSLKDDTIHTKEDKKKEPLDSIDSHDEKNNITESKSSQDRPSSPVDAGVADVLSEEMKSEKIVYAESYNPSEPIQIAVLIDELIAKQSNDSLDSIIHTNMVASQVSVC